MNIPTEIAWEIGIAIFGFIFGALWGHHGAISKRVTHDECSKKRDNCPCKQQIEDMENIVYNMQINSNKGGK